MGVVSVDVLLLLFCCWEVQYCVVGFVMTVSCFGSLCCYTVFGDVTGFLVQFPTLEFFKRFCSVALVGDVAWFVVTVSHFGAFC